MQPVNLETEFHANRDKIIINIDQISKILKSLNSEISSNNIFELKIPSYDNYQTVIKKYTFRVNNIP